MKRTLRVGLLANLAVMAIAVLIALGRVKPAHVSHVDRTPQGATVVTPNQMVPPREALVSPLQYAGHSSHGACHCCRTGGGELLPFLLVQQVSRHRNTPDAFL